MHKSVHHASVERGGVVNFPLGSHEVNKDDLSIVAIEASQLQKFGHAIQLDVTYDANNKLIGARVTHFQTCRACTNSLDKVS
jgi:hypothetical protein